MTWGWTRINDRQWRLGDRWTVEKTGGRWYAVRDGQACLADFGNEGAAMAEAERLKKEDVMYE